MTLPPLDMHAHVTADIAQSDLAALNAVIFAVTRNLREADSAIGRSDDLAVWGVGVHPGLVGAHKSFDAFQFEQLVARTSFVGEVGLDGKSRVEGRLQVDTFRQVLKIVQRIPRIVSVHSYEATDDVIGELERTPILGAILHWWLGDSHATKRAITAGSYFSINYSSGRRTDLLRQIPLDRVLTETDHPAGDRFGPHPRRPGGVRVVEEQIAQAHGLRIDEVRQQVWSNLRTVVELTRTEHLMPRAVRDLLRLA